MLKPCPWCGQRPEIVPWHGGGPNKTMVSCVNEMCAANPSVTAEGKRKAVALWNERKESTP